MGEVTSYDPNYISVLWGGMVLTGFADGEAITASYNEDHVSAKTGIKNDTMYSINGNRSGSVKLVLFNTSSSLGILRDDAVNHVEKSLMIRNAGSDGGYLIAADRCRILRAPGVSAGGEGGSQEINIYVPNLVIQGT